LLRPEGLTEGLHARVAGEVIPLGQRAARHLCQAARLRAVDDAEELTVGLREPDRVEVARDVRLPLAGDARVLAAEVQPPEHVERPLDTQAA